MPNLKFVSLTILELFAFNAQNLRGHVTLATHPVRKFFSGMMPGLCLGACMPHLKFALLVILEPLAFYTQKFTGSRDPGHAPFSKKFSGLCRDFPWEHACQI